MAGATALPAGQPAHEPEHAALVRPAAAPNVPAGHRLQTAAPASAKVPGGQGAQDTPAPGAPAKPAGQKRLVTVQKVTDVLPAPVVVLPTGQAVQAEEPAAE